MIIYVYLPLLVRKGQLKGKYNKVYDTIQGFGIKKYQRQDRIRGGVGVYR